MKKIHLVIFLLMSYISVGQDLTVISGGSITIPKDSYVFVGGDFTNTAGTVTLHSDSDEFSSLLVSGTASGDVTYNRYVNVVGDGEWDLIGAPVSGMAFSSLITDTNIATNGSFYAVGSYDNTTDTWTNATDATTGNLQLGQGYQMATTSGGTLSFTGAIADGDQTVTITNSDAENAGAGRRWNLIANPFASYLNGNIVADGTNNFLTVNTAAIDDNFEALYGWKADGTGYEIYNHSFNSNSAVYIAPGQGFFVAALSDGKGDDIHFTQAMQTVTGVDDFVAARSSASYELVLDMYSDAIKVDDTKFYFKEGLTLGLDPGYDAGAFNQSSGLSSRLLEQDNGIGMGINAMPTDAMSNAIVPLTINQEAGIALEIQIASSTIPEDINVYLEDTVENTFTLLTNEGFELTAQTTLSGVGRFFIHYTTSTLSTDTVSSTSLLTAYKGKGNTYISVEGLQQFSEPANLILYNVLGMKVLSKKIQSPSQKETLSTLGLKTGVYILKVQAENIVFTKKLVIE
ncbi:T9SS type A sorting domain-containing protein [Polaribacter sp.]|nr:T9SS type A sorting domain-containing protein [Polaribacter sp.]